MILKTQSGAEVTIGQLRKPPEFGSAKGFNTGQIAEGAPVPVTADLLNVKAKLHLMML